MPEPSNTDLAIAIAEVKGMVAALTQTTNLQMTVVEQRLGTADRERGDIRHRIEQLESWRSYLIGLGTVGTILGIYVALHIIGIIR